jgi:hypothetical protein
MIVKFVAQKDDLVQGVLIGVGCGERENGDTEGGSLMISFFDQNRCGTADTEQAAQE